MATAQESLAKLQATREQKIKEIEARKESRRLAGVSPQKDVLVQRLSDEISKLDVQISIREGVVREARGYEMTPEQQQQLISQREGGTFAAIRARETVSREAEAMAKERVRLERREYTTSEKARLKAWEEKFQMSPTEETERAILRGEKVEPFARVTPTLTPTEKFYKSLGLEPAKDVFGITYYAKPEPTPAPSMISAFEEPTTEQKVEAKYLKEMYGKPDFDIFAFPKEKLTDISESLGGLYRQFTGKQPTPEEEAFTIVGKPTYDLGVGGTMTFAPPKEEELSPAAGFYKAGIGEEIIASAQFEAKLEKKRADILREISPGGITMQEATVANIELEKYHKDLTKEFEKEFEVREKAREEKFFPKPITAKLLPEWDFKPEKFQRELYFKGIPGMGVQDIKIATAGISFVSGAYEGLRLHPIKTGLTAAAFVAMPVGFKVVGAVGKGIGVSTLVSAYPKTTALVGKGVRYGLGGVYGVGVAGRIAFTPGFYEKFGKAGEIMGTELLPMGVGWKVGAAGVRRYEAKAQLREWVRELPPKKKVLFEKQMLEAEAFGKVKPTVKEIELGRLKLLEKHPKVQEDIIKYFRGRKDIIVGGSIAQQTQMYGVPTKRPGDIDVYVKALGGETFKTGKYARDIANILKGYGMKRVRVTKGKVKVAGEKLVEFHPYKEYLRYNIEQVFPWYKPARMGITTTPSGIKIMKLGVQWRRKIVGGYLEPYISGKTRLKDLPSAEAIRKSMLKTARIQEAGQYPQLMSYGKLSMELSLPKSLKRVKAEISRGEGISFKPSKIKPSKISDYPYYKPKVGVPSYYPYKPSKDILYRVPYQPIKKKKITPYLPTQPPYKPLIPPKKPPRIPFVTSPYKPTPPIKPPPTTFFYDIVTPTPTKKKKKPPMIPDFKFGLPSKVRVLRAKRIFIRTPTIGAILQKELTGVAPKLRGELAEQTGLIERSFEGMRPKKVKLPVTLLGEVIKTQRII